MKNSDVVVGILGGLAVGAILGVLFAPDKGSNTRRKIAEKGTDLKDNLKGNFNDFVASIEDQYSNFTSNAEDVIEEGKSKLERMSNDISR
ncbi:YtxH domain-containing protein [Flavobacterium sp. HXWNR29]|jgi:gas vesicle protein|uniref:YtxH domain-containing protein n=1 Tax=Flavobacterium odoriferum TaxID=2946604 RepID=UPI0021CB4831|nr:YtxH domain-containing protein [Flavobacterium sp. HXWNR29]MCU4189974.1 YtxH domain-containing protein [Flavobacterium sp. HXWNR29]